MSFTDVETLFFKIVFILECNLNNLLRLANETKQIVWAMDIYYLDYVMTCNKEISLISNTVKKLWLPSDLYSSHLQNIYNDKE